MRIVMVCTGNTCRSPMAEHLLKRRLGEEGISNVAVESAGLAAYPGQPASGGALRAMNKRGVEGLAQHKARQFTQGVGQGALVLCMAQSHCDYIKGAWPGVNVHLLREYAGLGGDIADPYGQDDAAYERAAQQIEQAVQALSLGL